MRFGWLSPNDSRWESALGSMLSDVYHSPQYSTIGPLEPGDEARAAIVADGERCLLVPLVIRPIRTSVGTEYGVSDASTPYGYPGPIISAMGETDRQKFLARAVPSLIRGLADDGIVSVFIRMHPLLGLQPSDVDGWGTTVHHGDTVVVDLSASEEALWSAMRKGHRYDIRRSKKLGHRAFLDEDMACFARFQDIYADTMNRVGANDAYRFDSAYFSSLQDRLQSHLHLWLVEIDGATVAGSLFTEYDGIVQYHLSGTRSEFLKLQPSKLLLYEAIVWAKARGNRYMHLGGGVGGERDSLFAFKSGFSRETKAFHTWRLITNETVYHQLIGDTGTIHSGDEGFFPAYRS